MKITVYNQGGVSHTRKQKRIDEEARRRVQYSAADKVKILTAVDKMMAEENLHQNQAAALLQVSPSQIIRWRAKSSSLQQAARPNSLALKKGPAAFLADVKEQLVSYVSEWHQKGMDISGLSLIKKACHLSPGFASTCFMM